MFHKLLLSEWHFRCFQTDWVTPLSLVTIENQKYYPTACCSGSPVRYPANSDTRRVSPGLGYYTWFPDINKANLRDLKASTGLVISNWIKIVNFSTCVTVKFDGWPRKTIGHFFYTTPSFVHLFKSIGEFKLDLQSRNAQFGPKLVICYPMWPWNLRDDLEKQ